MLYQRKKLLGSCRARAAGPSLLKLRQGYSLPYFVAVYPWIVEVTSKVFLATFSTFIPGLMRLRQGYTLPYLVRLSLF